MGLRATYALVRGRGFKHPSRSWFLCRIAKKNANAGGWLIIIKPCHTAGILHHPTGAHTDPGWKLREVKICSKLQSIVHYMNFPIGYNLLTLGQLATLRDHNYVLVKLKSSQTQSRRGFPPRFGSQILQSCSEVFAIFALIIKWTKLQKVNNWT